MATVGDLEHGVAVAEGAPQRALGAFEPPAGLVHVQGLGGADALKQVVVGVGERVGDTGEDRVDRAA